MGNNPMPEVTHWQIHRERATAYGREMRRWKQPI